MIEVNKVHIKMDGSGKTIYKEWIVVTAALHELITERDGAECADRMLTTGLFTAVELSKKGELSNGTE